MRILPGLLAAVGSGAAIVKSASNVALIVGAIYLVDCRIDSQGREAVDRCYFTALPLMGVGIAGRGGFEAGYQTYNPALKRPEDDQPQPQPQPGDGRGPSGPFWRRGN